MRFRHHALRLDNNSSREDVEKPSLAVPVSGVVLNWNSALDQCRTLAHIATWPAMTTLSVSRNGPCAPPAALLIDANVRDNVIHPNLP
jgi:hypothetical protein